MKFLYKLIAFFFILSSPFIVNAGIFDDGTPAINICNWWECGLGNGVTAVTTWVTGLETSLWFSDYIQTIAIYVLSFISLIAVIYLMYAWFIVLTAAWDEEKLKKTKSIILYVIIWIVIIWLAWPIFTWVIWMLDSWSTASTWWSSCTACCILTWWAESTCLSGAWCSSTFCG